MKVSHKLCRILIEDIKKRPLVDGGQAAFFSIRVTLKCANQGIRVDSQKYCSAILRDANSNSIGFNTTAIGPSTDVVVVGWQEAYAGIAIVSITPAPRADSTYGADDEDCYDSEITKNAIN
ncbi:MAG: hypothetical protein PVJ39_13040 [Gammaproteobacteria bacterium]